MPNQQLTELNNLFGHTSNTHQVAHGRLSKTLLTIKLIIKCIFAITKNQKTNSLTLVYGDALLSNRGLVFATDDSILKTLLTCAMKLTPAVTYKGKGNRTALSLAGERIGFDYPGNTQALLNGNNTLVIFAEAQNEPVVIHFGESPLAKLSIDRHKRGLETALKHFKNTPIEHYIPKIVQSSTSKSNESLIETTINGETGATSKNEETITTRTIKIIDFAIEMQNYSPLKTNSKNFTTSIIECIEKNLTIEQLEKLDYAILIAKKWQEANNKTTAIHGDLWLENALFDKNDELQGIIDWEWQACNAPPIYDIVHCVLYSYANIRKVSFSNSLSSILSIENTDPWIISMTDYIKTKTGFTRTDQQAVAVIIWLSVIKRSHIETGPMSKQWIHTHIQELSNSLKSNHSAFDSLLK